MIQYTISVALGLTSAAFLVAVYALLPSRPKAYVSLDSSVTVAKYNESGLNALRICTIICALAQTAASVYFLYSVVGLGFAVSLPFALACLGWVFVAFVSGRINQVPNSVQGGHFSLFLILILLGSVNFLNSYGLFSSTGLFWSRDRIIAFSQTGVTSVLFLVYGSWSHRHEADDEEFISKESGSSIFSKLSFSWVNPLIKEGNSRSLEQNDLWGLVDDDRADLVLEQYRKMRNPSDSLTWRIFKFCYPYIIYQNACSLISSFLQFSGPLFLLQIISALEIPDVDRKTIIPSLLGLFFCSVVQFIINGQVFFTGRRVGTRARIILIEELYTKSLHRVEGTGTSTSEGDEQASLGKIVTLMSVDTERIREFLCYIHDPIVHIPVIIAVSITSLFFVLGWSAIAGVVVIVILGPISTWLGKLIIDIQEEQLQNTDARVSIMNELLQGIRIVKYFAWERYFKNKVEVAREKELASIVKLWKVYIGYGIIGHGSGIVIAFSTFFVHVVIFGNRLSASTAFTAINLLNIVRQGIMYLPSAIMQIFKAKVSMTRIENYLKEKDIAKHSNDEKVNSDESSEAGTATDSMIGFHSASFRYYNSEETVDGEIVDGSNPPFNLRNLNVEFPDQKLSVICGPTGSGKSSLLLALLGEMECTDGQYFLPKSEKVVTDPVTGLNNTVAYAAQTAWLLNATVRDNILFGEEYDAKRYEAVIRGCALAKDFENLDGGDLTEIGEKGINVSGGQKQRISLARACYSRSAIVFLDDPLSAVDAPTARFLLHKCVLGLLKGRTVLLVSHATHLVVPFADCVVSIKNGEILSSGTPAEVTKNPADESLFGLDLTQDLYEEDDEETIVAVATAVGGGTQLVDDEEKSSGSVKFSVYKSYFVATGGVLFLALFSLGFVLTTASSVGNDWWLKVWTDHNAEVYGDSISVNSFSSGTPALATHGTFLPSAWSAWYIPSKSAVKIHSLMSSNTEEDANTIFYLGVYACFGLGVILAGTVQDVIVLLGALWASRRLHRELLDAVLYSPLRFFETTPVGRILNRFSKDIENIDSNVINTVYYFIYSIIRSATVVAVIGTIAPPFLLIVPVIGVLYLYVAQLYLNTSRELKRLEAISRSPIYSQFSETLAGVSTIRAFEAEPRFTIENLKKIDENHKPFFYMWAANRWLCLRTDLLSAVVVLFAGLNVVFGGVGAGWAALTITYALDFTDALLWTVRMHAEMEMSMNSVERVEEYTAIEQEPAAIIEEFRPSADWPQEGVIEVRDLSMRYAPDLPDVLKNISFSVKPHEKVAVVGRTGAGKSTLSLAFFRIIPLSSGSVVIDGHNISTIGLYDLRSRLTIIPQDPVLFNGTLRSNLDPLEENDDESLWEALKRVNFTDSIQQTSTASSSLMLIQDADQTINSTTSTTSTITLDYTVAENGSNFSQGQRQLLCLARSLLQRNKIIFLDEATASVDNETDAKIQTTIRREFKDSTIICIAHRLRTVIDYDKILVLDKGEVKEFGTPLDLIEAGGQFRSMCEETGEFDELLEIARSSQ